MLPNIQQLFSLDKTFHEEIFDGVEHIWEVVTKISIYTQEFVSRFSVDQRIGMAKIHPSAVIDENVIIGDGTEIGPHVVIKGPTIIGKNCEIRPGAYIRGNAIIGDDCVIGNSTEIKNALLFDEVKIPHFNYVGDSILGYKVHFGGGAATANFKGNGSTITIQDGKEHYDTAMNKLGAFVGDYGEIGANALLNPGTIIGRNTIIYPGAVIRGSIPEQVIVKIRQQQEMVPRQ